MTTVTGKRYHTEIYNTIDREAEARGELRGRVESVLDLLEDRGVPVSAEIRRMMLGCTDLERVRHWQRSALTAATVQDVIEP